MRQSQWSVSGDRPVNTYLEASIRSASPPRLRLMLIERAAGLCECISQQWKHELPEVGCGEQTLHLRDILTELLAGVARTDLPLAHQVADLYVFLIQHLDRAESTIDVSMVDEIRVVLETEAQTWRMVCAQATAAQQDSAALVTSPRGNASNLNLQG